MKFHDEQLRILKELILKYQREKNEIVFYQILQRVDKMITEMIGAFSRRYYFNESTSQILQDMYQTAIVGLKNAVDAFKPENKEKDIPICIFYWIRKAIFEMYGVKKFNTSQYLYEHPDCIEKPEIDSGLIQEDIKKIIKSLIDSKRITEEELQLLILVHIERMSISEILRVFGDEKWGKRSKIAEKIERISGILKREFEKKGFGN